MPIIAKGKYVNGKPPIICVPVTESGFADVIDKITKLVNSGVEMIEWRADYFEEVSDIDRVKSLLENLREVTKDVLFLVTLRSKEQGGKCDLSEDEMKEILFAVAETHVADFVDVEAFTFSDTADLVAKLQNKGALVIASHHDFEETPRPDTMEEWLRQMKALDPDLVKLAVMPQGFSDVLSLMEVGRVFGDNNPSLPLISISMGQEGLLSRIAGEVTKSVITFGTEGEASAPGQIPREDLKELLNLVHKYV